MCFVSVLQVNWVKMVACWSNSPVNQSVLFIGIHLDPKVKMKPAPLGETIHEIHVRWRGSFHRHRIESISRNPSTLHCSSVKATHMIVSRQQRRHLSWRLAQLQTYILCQGRGPADRYKVCFHIIFSFLWNMSLYFLNADNMVWLSNQNWKYSNCFRAGAPPTAVVFSVATQTGKQRMRQERSFETWLVLNSPLLPASEYQQCCHTTLQQTDRTEVNSTSLSPLSLSTTHRSSPIYINLLCGCTDHSYPTHRGRMLLRMNCTVSVCECVCVWVQMHSVDLTHSQAWSGPTVLQWTSP